MTMRAPTVHRAIGLPLPRWLPNVRPIAASWRSVAATEGRLGLVPTVALLGSFGLFVVALSDTAGRLVLPGAQLLFWVGFLSLVLPFAYRLLGSRASRNERVILVVLLGLGLYMVKVLHSPSSFTLFDEFHHWATLDDIVATGRLYTHNNILPASPFYPGLEITADPLVLAGGSVFDAGVLIVAAARLLLVLALFLLMERVSGSPRIAGLGTLIYMANPGFLFFDAQFAYESLALPLALFVCWLVVRRERGTRSQVVPLTIAILMGIGGVIVTHHVTSILLAGFLLAWSVVAVVVRLVNARFPRENATALDVETEPLPDHPGPGGPALIASTATVSWMLYWASVTVGYLAPAFGGAVSQLVNLIAGEESSRELFKSRAGGASPFWEQFMGYASVAVLVLALLVGVAIVWRTRRRNVTVVLLALTALAYPATLAARFTSFGAELSARSAEFVFVGLGFVAAYALVWAMDSGRLRRWGTATAMAVATIVFMGGVVVGTPYWARLPGPFLVSADPRSVSPVGIDSATWMLDHLGVDNKLMTDRVNRVLTKTYGLQHPISAVGDQIDVKSAFFSDSINGDIRRLLRKSGVKYVEADERLPTSLPYVGVYVERGELNSHTWNAPMSVTAITKWATMGSVDLIYDAGDIRLYNIQPLTNVRD